MSCHSCLLSWFACPVGVFVHYSGYHLFPWLALGTITLIGVLVGRMLCGWVCPFGFLQDLLHKIPTRKFRLPKWTSWIKYVVLLLTVLLVPFLYGEESKLVFCRYCPASFLQVTLPHLVGGGTISTWTLIKGGVTVGVIVGVILSERAFCKLLCPIGAMMAPFNFVSLWILKVPDPDCLGCVKCGQVCPTDCAPNSRVEIGVPANRALDCVVCHDCQPPCPQKSDRPRQPGKRRRAELEQMWAGREYD